jgi:hypothetical protein
MSTATQTYRATMAEAELLLSRYDNFNAGSLTAFWFHNEAGNIYTVMSYGEVIATHTAGTDFKKVWDHAYNHSKTTSKHANMVKRAWSIS